MNVKEFKQMVGTEAWVLMAADFKGNAVKVYIN